MSAAPQIGRFLPEVEGGGPGDVGAGVRAYVEAVREYLGELHRAGAAGHTVNETHSDLIDRLVRHLFGLAEEGHFAGGGEQSDVSVLAVGGYARREMNIHSDVDLLFLYRKSISPHVKAVAERMQTWLWDSSMTVGAATRNVADTIDLARREVSVKTAVLEPRLLIGSGVLFHEFSSRLRSALFSDPARFIKAQIESLEERHTQFGDSLYLLQPNLKEGAGGLRDYHTSYWIMQASQPSRGRDDFLHLGLLTEDELKEYDAALDFLWRVRNELHIVSGRKNDQLSFELQESIAEALGYDAGAGAHGLAVERFMGEYYRHARAIRNYSSLVIEQCRARVQRSRRRRRVREVEDGFRVADGRLEIPHARQLRENPVLLLRAFAVAQRYDVGLTRKARRLIREALPLIDDDFRRSAEAREEFLRILEAEHRVMRSLVAMNEVGLLAAFLPEWEHIVCLWQHVMYHTYTVDVHSIFLVEELRRLWRGKHEDVFPAITELCRAVDDRPVLFLGCLLHDIGKGFGANHSMKGAERARVCLDRLGLEPDRIDRVVFLVEHHLLMSHLAQRRDLSDPKLILDFARTVGDRTNLRNLYLLTYADVRASSADAWTDWKGQLLRDLFERTSEFLEAGADDPTKALELIEGRVGTRREAAATELRSLGVSDVDIEAYFETMPQRYFISHTPRQIARHAQVVLELQKGEPFATAVREMRGGFSELILCSRDVHALFANVAGTLTATDLNILGAHVYTTRSGLALEVYRVETPPGGEEERGIAWADFRRSLGRVLAGEVGVAELLARRGRRVSSGRPPSHRPVTVEVSNEESDFYTIVDIAANDRPGLLHDLTRTIAEHGFSIFISKAATILDQVTDTFYLKDAEAKKIGDPVAIERLRDALLEAARAGEGEGGG